MSQPKTKKFLSVILKCLAWKCFKKCIAVHFYILTIFPQIEEICVSTHTEGTCEMSSDRPLQMCEMSNPLRLVFYIDTSINNRRYNLDHYSLIISGILSNFAFMHSDYLDFKGQNQFIIYGYSAIGAKVQIQPIFQSDKQNIKLTGTTHEALNHVLVNMQTAIRDPSNIRNNPTRYQISLDSITEHFENNWKMGKGIILRDGKSDIVNRVVDTAANYTSPIFVASTDSRFIKFANSSNLQ